MAAAEARAAALRLVGNLTQIQVQCRDMRRINHIEHLVQDLQYALRSIRNAPAFSSLVALGAGNRREYGSL